MKAVADPRLGENVVRVRRIKLNFLAELADEDAQVLGLLDVVTTPDSPQQNAMREHFPGMADQVYQQVVFLRRQMHLLTPYGDPAGVQVATRKSPVSSRLVTLPGTASARRRAARTRANSSAIPKGLVP